MKLKTRKLFIAAAICLSMFSSQNATAGKDAKPGVMSEAWRHTKCMTCRKSTCGGENWSTKGDWCSQNCQDHAIGGCKQGFYEGHTKFYKEKAAKEATPSPKEPAPEKKKGE